MSHHLQIFLCLVLALFHQTWSDVNVNAVARAMTLSSDSDMEAKFCLFLRVLGFNTKAMFLRVLDFDVSTCSSLV